MLIESIIKPKRPRIEGWKRASNPPDWLFNGFEAETWYHPAFKLVVISAVEVAAGGRGPEYHISVTRAGHKRCRSQDAKQVLRQFGMEGAEEDNHVPYGIARNFWKPVAENLIGAECACKKIEAAVIEDKGDYVWREDRSAG